MRILVTGHRGYVGSVLVSVLRNARHDVVGLDCDYYAGCDFGRVQADFPAYDFDVREIESVDLLSFDAVVHLADVPLSSSSPLDPLVARQATEDAGLRLARVCREASIRHFVFASTVEVYGSGTASPAKEDGPLEPHTPRGRAKLRCERVLLDLHDDAFAVTVLRQANVFGVSPRLRLDLLVNDLVASATVNQRILVRCDGSAWHPLVHVEDLARVYGAVLEAPVEKTAGRVFNVVAPNGNRRIADIADAIVEFSPNCARFASPTRWGRFTCSVDGGELASALPDFRFRWDLASGVRQLRAALMGAGLSPGDWRSDRFRRAMRMQHLMERGEVNYALRRASTPQAASAGIG